MPSPRTKNRGLDVARATARSSEKRPASIVRSMGVLNARRLPLQYGVTPVLHLRGDLLARGSAPVPLHEVEPEVQRRRYAAGRDDTALVDDALIGHDLAAGARTRDDAWWPACPRGNRRGR